MKFKIATIILTLALIGSWIYFLNKKQSTVINDISLAPKLYDHFFNIGVPESEGRPNILSVNNDDKHLFAGVWYDKDSIYRYVTSTFQHLISLQPKNPNEAKYQWKVGFYWMKREDPLNVGNIKPSFYVVPILVDTTADQSGKHLYHIIDYFHEKISNQMYHFTENYFYDHSHLSGKILTDCPDCPLFDDGNMFP